MSLVRNASAENWTNGMCFNHSDNILSYGMKKNLDKILNELIIW